ncbi:beta-ketoacyl synthase, C-terminal domain protein [Collimonas fungivorans]|uniref:Beta-ketoacyl synthase, C-terminal domain protein n=1 Tax=Collimonas fungivorans TaxID=158899 RepID=A0A127PAN6_9BURK|nr:beta-ketoacyl-[acyl-carrier-protein] synthase family protein [Collimonas fungivorans]AMO94704.1 beta-ketoacyl synthase, C-terminal domain protein [Collimonas fungivorans]
MSSDRIVVTGIAINTPIGDTLDNVGNNLLSGKSAIGYWQNIDTSNTYSKIGGQLRGYDIEGKLHTFEGRIPDIVLARAKRVFKQTNKGVQRSVLMAMDAWLDAGLFERSIDPFGYGIVCGGHNLSDKYLLDQQEVFADEPEFIDAFSGLNSMDTDHSSSVAQVLNAKGFAYLVGGTCATGNVAIQAAINAIKVDKKLVVAVVSPMASFHPMMLHSLTILEAICYSRYQDQPAKASRPYDADRSGFLPCEGGAVLILEQAEHAQSRGARIYAELLGASVNSDANHLGDPSHEGQVRVIQDVLKKCNVSGEQVDYVSAHATSTKIGDIVELESIKKVFGAHAEKLLINAPKSLLGHTMWASGVVEAAVAIWQMRRGEFHQSHNIETLDSAVDLDVCAYGNVKKEVDFFLNNSFGMGGINSASLFRRYHG